MLDRHRNMRRHAQRQADLAAARTKDDDVLEEKGRKEIAAVLIARRVVLGISDADLIERLGFHEAREALKKMRPGNKRDLRVYQEARRIERDLLTDGRLSTFQRYARVVGMRLDMGMESQAATRLRRRLSVQRYARYIRTRRRYLANKYSQQPKRRRFAA